MRSVATPDWNDQIQCDLLDAVDVSQNERIFEFLNCNLYAFCECHDEGTHCKDQYIRNHVLHGVVGCHDVTVTEEFADYPKFIIKSGDSEL